ncbi:MAG: hypothetical protein LBU33_01840 [Endomicrobium sp.]|nr:hypothetical protein [Endomicrobium sp.]MDR3092639.1 hypothetical protein [Endomicrobium sp.]
MCGNNDSLMFAVIENEFAAERIKKLDDKNELITDNSQCKNEICKKIEISRPAIKIGLLTFNSVIL